MFFFLPSLTADQKSEVRKNMVLQFIGGKSVEQIKSRVPFSIRTIYRWISRFCPGSMESLRNRQRTGRPRQWIDRHAAWICAIVIDQNPAQCPCEFAWRTTQRVRQALREKFGSVLSASPVRRSLRRLLPTPQRSQRRTTQSEPADVQRWQDPELPKILRRAREWGARFRRRVRPGCAERVRKHWGHPRAAPVMRAASGRFRLHWPATSNPEGQLEDRVREGPATAEVFRE